MFKLWAYLFIFILNAYAKRLIFYASELFGSEIICVQDQI
jgi:hypothetical protein